MVLVEGLPVNVTGSYFLQRIQWLVESRKGKEMKQPNRAERRLALRKRLLELADLMKKASANIRRGADPEFDEDCWLDDASTRTTTQIIVDVAYTAQKLRKFDLFFDLPPCVLVEIQKSDLKQAWLDGKISRSEATSTTLETFAILGLIAKGAK